MNFREIQRIKDLYSHQFNQGYQKAFQFFSNMNHSSIIYPNISFENLPYQTPTLFRPTVELELKEFPLFISEPAPSFISKQNTLTQLSINSSNDFSQETSLSNHPNQQQSFSTKVTDFSEEQKLKIMVFEIEGKTITKFEPDGNQKQPTNQSKNNQNNQNNENKEYPEFSSFIKFPLTLGLFNNDFNAILRFCLSPDNYSPLNHETDLNSDSLLLIQLIDQHRLKVLRKEQKIKKIINLAFRILLQKYLSWKYKNIIHISEAMKKDFCNYYFGHLTKENQEFQKPNFRSLGKNQKSAVFSLTYNKKFFKNVQNCQLFLTDFKESIHQIYASIFSTIKGDLRRFLKHVEKFVFFDHPELDKKIAIQHFFDLKNKFNRKQGIKFPWTENQYKDSIDCVLEEFGIENQKL